MMPISFKTLALLTSVFIFFNASAQAKLIIVADRGGEQTQPYYEELGLSVRLVIESSDDQKIPPIITPVTVIQMLPVISAKITPGQVRTRSIKAQGLSPFFIIGDDALSKQWLIKRKDELLKIGAKGLVVNVQSSDELAILQTLAPELLLLPTYGDDIAERLNLAHYPVLITAEIITQ